MLRRWKYLVPAAVLMLGAACSSSSSVATPAPTTGAATTSPTTVAGAEVAVELQEFAVIPDVATVSAGAITFNVTNTGPDDTHEFVIIKTDIDAADLPVDKDGAALEEANGLDPITEIEDLKVGDTQALTAELEPGAYVFICNIVQKEPDGSLEAHYHEGMRVGFTVT